MSWISTKTDENGNRSKKRKIVVGRPPHTVRRPPHTHFCRERDRLIGRESVVLMIWVSHFFNVGRRESDEQYKEENEKGWFNMCYRQSRRPIRADFLYAGRVGHKGHKGQVF